MNFSQQTALDKILLDLKKNPCVVGVILFGSLAQDYGHDKSDVDLYVVVEDKIDKTTTKYMDNSFVQIQWRSLSDFKNKVTKYNRSLPLCLACKILFDRNGEINLNVERGKKAATLGPIKLDEQSINGARLALTQDFEALAGLIMQKRDADAALLINELLFEALSVLYDYHGWWLPQRKRIISDLVSKDKALVKECETVILDPAIDYKVRSLKSIIDHVLSLIGGELREIEIFF